MKHDIGAVIDDTRRDNMLTAVYRFKE